MQAIQAADNFQKLSFQPTKLKAACSGAVTVIQRLGENSFSWINPLINVLQYISKIIAATKIYL